MNERVSDSRALVLSFEGANNMMSIFIDSNLFGIVGEKTLPGSKAAIGKLSIVVYCLSTCNC